MEGHTTRKRRDSHLCHDQHAIRYATSLARSRLTTENNACNPNLEMSPADDRDAVLVRIADHVSPTISGTCAEYLVIAADAQLIEIPRINQDARPIDGCPSWIGVVPSAPDGELGACKRDDFEDEGNLDGVPGGDKAGGR